MVTFFLVIGGIGIEKIPNMLKLSMSTVLVFWSEEESVCRQHVSNGSTVHEQSVSKPPTYDKTAPKTDEIPF
jgi:hypothetical protein